MTKAANKAKYTWDAMLTHMRDADQLLLMHQQAGWWRPWYRARMIRAARQRHDWLREASNQFVTHCNNAGLDLDYK